MMKEIFAIEFINNIGYIHDYLIWLILHVWIFAGLWRYIYFYLNLGWHLFNLCYPKRNNRPGSHQRLCVTFIDVFFLHIALFFKIYYHHPFHLYNDLRWNLTMPQGFEAINEILVPSFFLLIIDVSMLQARFWHLFKPNWCAMCFLLLCLM